MPSNTAAASHPDHGVKPAKLWAGRLAQCVITLLFPVLLVLLAVRLVMTPLFLQVEYQRPGFPEDYYGFSTEDRLHYGPTAIEYLLSSADISLLADLSFSDGGTLYNIRELGHMRDVKIVTQAAFTFGLFGAVLFVLCTLYLYRTQRDLLLAAVARGAWLTVGLIVAIVIGAVVAWDAFFTLFHNLFFTSGTWQFAYSDTLIRLFPEQFWFDAAIVIGGITFTGSLIPLLLIWLISRNQSG
ncbi:MAG: TIGR01906 family membrane protein [Anaerolineae bacterium]|nr:TIGR01906 family membrane protein [Anaerolineae bacterium]